MLCSLSIMSQCRHASVLYSASAILIRTEMLTMGQCTLPNDNLWSETICLTLHVEHKNILLTFTANKPPLHHAAALKTAKNSEAYHLGIAAWDKTRNKIQSRLPNRGRQALHPFRALSTPADSRVWHRDPPRLYNETMRPDHLQPSCRCITQTIAYVLEVHRVYSKRLVCAFWQAELTFSQQVVQR